MTPKICPNCYYVGKPKKIAKGEFILELILWLVGLIPGIIYSLWRFFNKREECPTCKAQNLLLLDSPRGMELWAHVLPDEQTRKEKLSIMKRQYEMEGLANASLVLGIIGILSSFLFGLGIVPSMFAVMLGIYLLIKKGSREMAIVGLTLGLLGTLISYSCFNSLDRPGEKIEEGKEKREEKPMETALKLGEGVRINDFLVTLESIQITRAYATSKYSTYTLKDGYKFVVVKVTCNNVGKKKSYIVINYNNIEVDKGYIYEADPRMAYVRCDLSPEESYSGEFIIEILGSTTPAKLHTTIGGKRFIVDVTGAEESTESVNNEETPKETTQQEEKTAPKAQEEYMPVTPFPSSKPVKRILRRDCEDPEGNIVFHGVQEGACPEGSKEVTRY